MYKIFQLLLVIMVLALTGCAKFHIYQPDVQQGNVFSQEQISQLKPGMSKGEVKYLLGTSLLQNSFEQNRWDYVYTFNKQGKIIETKRLTLHFNNDRLIQVEQSKSP
jgi:outer membrane protein assembly factor BamE